MEINIEITKWWAILESEPSHREIHPGYDGRRIVLHGLGIVPDAYYQTEDRVLDGSTCRVFLRPLDPLNAGEEKLSGSGYWSKESADVWAYLTVYLHRPLWEDFWRRTYHSSIGCRMSLHLHRQKGLSDGALATIGSPTIEFSSGT